MVWLATSVQAIFLSESVTLISKDLFLLIWNDSNIFSTEISRSLSLSIRNFFIDEKKYLMNQNNQLIYENDLYNLIESIIKNNKKINNTHTIWIIIKNENNINKYYLITEIINF